MPIRASALRKACFSIIVKDSRAKFCANVTLLPRYFCNGAWIIEQTGHAVSEKKCLESRVACRKIANLCAECRINHSF